MFCSLDPCQNHHCKHGKVCELDESNTPMCVCQDPTSCPAPIGEFEKVRVGTWAQQSIVSVKKSVYIGEKLHSQKAPPEDQSQQESGAESQSSLPGPTSLAVDENSKEFTCTTRFQALC